MSAPWTSSGVLSLVLGLYALGGLGYGAIVLRRAHRQTEYTPVKEDWFWYVVLPFVAYTALATGAASLSARPHTALFVIGGSALGLLLVGIHNAWDTVIHIVISSSNDGTTKME
jgi:hypothetical protein